MTITIDGIEVLCGDNFTISQEMLNTPSVILNNVYPKSWETDKDYTSSFYHPADYSQCLIRDENNNLLFCGVVKNSGDISLNPRHPHYSTLQILDYKTFLSEGESLDFVIANKTILEALQDIIEVISPYGFELGNVSIIGECSLHGEVYSLDVPIKLGESRTIDDSIIVTEADILGRTGWNISCVASGTSFLGEAGEFTTSMPITIAQPNPNLVVSYETLNSPQDGNAWTNEETVRYCIRISNEGNLTLTNVQVEDLETGISKTIDELLPYTSRTIEDNLFKVEIANYPDQGIITCNASAAATAPNNLTPTIRIIKLLLVTDKNTGFQYTVNTTLQSSTNKLTSAPFSATNDGLAIIDWGDGTTSEFTSATEDKTHSYESPGTYAVTVSSDDWSKIALTTYSSTTAVTADSNPTLYWFRNTLVSLDGSLPELANTGLSYAFCGCSKLTSISEYLFFKCENVSLFSYCFYGCSRLTSLPENLFSRCTSATSFAYCFYNCSNLVAIPSSIFSGCSAATTFHSCFYNCSNLEVIPENLFKDCIGVTNFHALFRGCTKMKTIPEDLFKYNTLATDFGGVFWSCQNIQSIPEDLLRYNVAATNVGAFFCSARGPAFANFPVNFLKYNVNVTSLTADNYGFFESSAITSFSIRIGSSKVSNAQYFCYNIATTGVTRTVYVPAGSTTKNTMQSYASSFALTIVEE